MFTVCHKGICFVFKCLFQQSDPDVATYQISDFWPTCGEEFLSFHSENPF